MVNKKYTSKDINGKGLDYIGNHLYKHNVSGNLYKETSDGLKPYKKSFMGVTKTQFVTSLKIKKQNFLKHIRIGDWVEALIHTITLGYGERISLFIAKLFGYNSCGCCQRKQWLNRLTNRYYDGECDGVNLF